MSGPKIFTFYLLCHSLTKNYAFQIDWSVCQWDTPVRCGLHWQCKCILSRCIHHRTLHCHFNCRSITEEALISPQATPPCARWPRGGPDPSESRYLADDSDDGQLVQTTCSLGVAKRLLFHYYSLFTPDRTNTMIPFVSSLALPFLVTFVRGSCVIDRVFAWVLYLLKPSRAGGWPPTINRGSSAHFEKLMESPV